MPNYHGIDPDAEEKLPEGWEKRKAPDGRWYYIDHNTGTTHWVSPNSAERVALAQDLKAVEATYGAAPMGEFKTEEQLAKEDTGSMWGTAHWAMGAAGAATAQGIDWTRKKWIQNNGDGKVEAAQAATKKAYEDNTGRSVEADGTSAKASPLLSVFLY